METVTVLILSSTKCREVNKLPKPIAPQFTNPWSANKALRAWNKIESSLREWEIENGGMIYDSGDNVKQNIEYKSKYSIGSTCSAQIVNNKAIIQ